MLLCNLGLGELAHVRMSDGPIIMRSTTLMRFVCHLPSLSPSPFPFLFPFPFFSFPFHSVLLSLRFFLCPFAFGPQEEKLSKKLGWKIRKVPRKRRKVMVSFSVASQAEGQNDCNLFLLSLAFFQAVQPSSPLAAADAVCLVCASGC